MTLLGGLVIPDFFVDDIDENSGFIINLNEINFS